MCIRDSLKRVGVEKTKNYIQRFGFTLEELPRGLSLALGTAEVSPLQMAGAYALFANGGFQVKLYFIDLIENGDGEVIFQPNPPRACLNCWVRYRATGGRPPRLRTWDGPMAPPQQFPGRADTNPRSSTRDNIHDAGCYLRTRRH